MEATSTPLANAIVHGTVLEIGLLLTNGSDPATASTGGHTPLHVAAGRGRLEVCAMLLDAGADPSARTARGSRPKDLAGAGGHVTVGFFLGMVEIMLADGETLSPGHSYLELARIAREAAREMGDLCPTCAVPVPPAARSDHVGSHAWETQMKKSGPGGHAAGGRRSTVSQRPHHDSPVSGNLPTVPRGKEALFRGPLGNLGVSATHLTIGGLFGNTTVVPLESIQSIGLSLSGLSFRRTLDIQVAGSYHQWDSGQGRVGAERIRQLILDARAALLASRSS